MTGLGKLGMTARRAGVWLAMVLMASVIFAAVPIAQAQLGLHPVPPTKDFFRIKARYVVKATGEVIQFDLVRPCQAVTARDMYGDRIWVPPPIEWSSYFYTINPIFPKVTGDHHLIIMRIPNGCFDRGNGVQVRTANGLVPKDLLPAVIWYDDPDEPQFGWEYATEDAYASPFAKLAFEGATIEDANHDDFIEWQKNAPTGFRPSKVVKHPFGFTFAQEQGFEDGNRTERTFPIALGCFGAARFKLSGATRDLADLAWPSDHPHFWTLKASEEDGKQRAAGDLFKNVFGRDSLDTLFEEGFPLNLYRFQDNWISPTRAGGGYERHDIHPLVLFPLIHAPFFRPFLQSDEGKTDLLYELDVRPQMQGFLACFNPPLPHTFPPGPLGRDKRLSWRISSEPVAGLGITVNQAQFPDPFFENDQYVFTRITP